MPSMSTDTLRYTITNSQSQDTTQISMYSITLTLRGVTPKTGGFFWEGLDAYGTFMTRMMTASQRCRPPSEKTELALLTDETLHPADDGHGCTQLFLSCTWVCFSPHPALSPGSHHGGNGIQCCSSSYSGMAKNMLPDILSENTRPVRHNSSVYKTWQEAWTKIPWRKIRVSHMFQPIDSQLLIALNIFNTRRWICMVCNWKTKEL